MEYTCVLIYAVRMYIICLWVIVHTCIGSSFCWQVFKHNWCLTFSSYLVIHVCSLAIAHPMVLCGTLQSIFTWLVLYYIIHYTVYVYTCKLGSLWFDPLSPTHHHRLRSSVRRYLTSWIVRLTTVTAWRDLCSLTPLPVEQDLGWARTYWSISMTGEEGVTYCVLPFSFR